MRAKLDHELRNAGEHMVLLKYYHQLIALRKIIPTLAPASKREVEVIAGSLSPKEFDTVGENGFTLAARSCALFVRDREEPAI